MDTENSTPVPVDLEQIRRDLVANGYALVSAGKEQVLLVDTAGGRTVRNIFKTWTADGTVPPELRDGSLVGENLDSTQILEHIAARTGSDLHGGFDYAELETRTLADAAAEVTQVNEKPNRAQRRKAAKRKP